MPDKKECRNIFDPCFVSDMVYILAVGCPQEVTCHYCFIWYGTIREPYVQPGTSNKDLPYADDISCDVYSYKYGMAQRMLTIRGCPDSYLDEHVILMCNATATTVTPGKHKYWDVKGTARHKKG